ncbi:MAG: carbamoyltransferase HypF [Proteobacteria bacterium]|nr:carbamoyltransferase HypF [Pseudomonadota bacterium]
MSNNLQSLQILITGRVQGVGFRPFVSRIANGFDLSGWVLNRSGEVEIRVEGSPDNLKAFQRALIEQAPPLAQPNLPRCTPVPPEGLTGFIIKHSESGERADVHIPPDYFVCGDCLAEMQDPNERRYRYPFINCTQCGPRYTLIDRLPYDRPNTAMAGFELCPACRAEYENPLDRRYHAQPLACAECGPSLIFQQPGQPDMTGNQAAIDACLDALRKGLIVAVKGVGGYHLMCDATQNSAVDRLRTAKNRPAKPLAVLLPSLGADGLDFVREVANPEPCEVDLLKSPLRPIVLMRKRQASTLLAETIAPGLREVGLMLAYSPLHHLLIDAFGKPLVATSANISGEPVLTEGGEVEKRLGQVADAFLHHNRPIRRPADDSVFRRIAGKPRPMRLGRGLGPVERVLPFELKHPVLAVGADLKNTVALGFGKRLVISPHIGDLGTVRSTEVFERVIADLQELYAIKPSVIVCDAHPDYRSSRWARKQAIPTIEVFHHHAHASALAGEHGIGDDMLVFTWDGVGFGEDRTIWGGEALLGRPGAWRRVGSMRPFRLLGGDKANREPWRCGLALCLETGITWESCLKDSELLRHAWERNINCPVSTSAGRLFDAAAALTGLGLETSFEGQAAMQLESLSGPVDEYIEWPLQPDATGLWRADWGPLLPMLMDDSLSIAERGSLFHASIARLISTQAIKIRDKHGINKVGLSGGVFQNRLLTEKAAQLLAQEGFEVFLPDNIPTNDAGISYGQIIEAAAQTGQV